MLTGGGPRRSTLGDAIRLESRETIRRKEGEVAELQAQVQHLHGLLQQQQQQNGDAQALHEQQLLERLRIRDAEVESLEQIKDKMMADRTVLEQVPPRLRDSWTGVLGGLGRREGWRAGGREVPFGGREGGARACVCVCV